jgi:hypothetical protein
MRNLATAIARGGGRFYVVDRVRDVYLANGESDRMALGFLKP